MGKIIKKKRKIKLVRKPDPVAPATEVTKLTKAQREVNWQMADRMTKNMKLIDLKRACIARGMPFEELGTHSVLSLHSWFAQHLDNSQDLNLLNEYDEWFKVIMVNERNYEPDDPIFHPSLMLGYNPDSENDEPKKRIRLKGLKKPEKPKAERVPGTKVIKGTKKAMTYELAKQGLTLKEVIEKVEEAYEDAKESSIAIWYRRAIKETK